MPEKGEAQNAPQDVGSISLGEHLRHHRQKPHEPEGHVQAVAADEGEEGRQKSAALRTRAYGVIMPTNSRISRNRKPAPNKAVTAIAP